MKRSHVLFDVAVLAVYLLVANPVLTGIPLHEFVGLGTFSAKGPAPEEGKGGEQRGPACKGKSTWKEAPRPSDAGVGT